ncbi:MFS transporter [Roseibium sp. SCPC15]|uniref:MFS transporter n=1 Tax=Roseibium sp. SCP15 TaxID=3141376 RepID=UPI0033385DDF
MNARDTHYFLLLNAGHFLDHYVMLIFATVVALALSTGWQMSYSDLLLLGTPGFAAFAIFSLPAGWLADRWSRDGMMCVFFFGLGVTSILTGFAQSPGQIAVGLFLIGIFAAIYHPVGLAIVTARWKKTGMRLAVNGVWGNLGVGAAALFTGILIDTAGWRAAFFVPGLISICLTWPYYRVSRDIRVLEINPKGGGAKEPDRDHGSAWRILICVFLTAALGSAIFQSTTVALPEIFEERLTGLADRIATSAIGILQLHTASVLGALAFSVFAAASMAQLLTGYLLDRVGGRPTLALVAAIQTVFFLLMPGLTGAAGYLVALGFMLGVFGQIPVNDFLIGTTTRGRNRSRAFGLRYLVSFLAMSAALPLIALVHEAWGFDGLFLLLAGLSATILVSSQVLLAGLKYQKSAPKTGEACDLGSAEMPGS